MEEVICINENAVAGKFACPMTIYCAICALLYSKVSARLTANGGVIECNTAVE